jgi:hypothetical protein
MRVPGIRRATKTRTPNRVAPKTSGAKAAQIAFLNVIHNFLRDRAFAPAPECYAGNDSDIFSLR